jgi:hypothetical protein
MERMKQWTVRFVWPDVSNEEGRFVACSIGAAALLSIASTYAYLLLELLSGDDHPIPSFNKNGFYPLVLFGLGAGVIATIYLANRIWRQQCQVAAWVGLMWLGYETVNALLGITAENPVILLILSFAAFHGVRGCFFSPDVADDS